jgi:hypothetical protein
MIVGLEWPSPHDCTGFIWDELKFIPIIGYAACIEVGSKKKSLVYSRLPIKKSIWLPKHFQSQLLTFAPPKTLNLTITQELKQCCRRWCYRSNVDMLLQKTMLQRQCWSNSTEDDAIEAVLKRCCRRCCWSGVVENAPLKDN